MMTMCGEPCEDCIYACLNTINLVTYAVMEANYTSIIVAWVHE